MSLALTVRLLADVLHEKGHKEESDDLHAVARKLEAKDV